MKKLSKVYKTAILSWQGIAGRFLINAHPEEFWGIDQKYSALANSLFLI